MSEQNTQEMIQSSQEFYKNLVADSKERLETVAASPECAEDPAFTPLLTQLENHLKHVSYTFRVANNAIDEYPYDLRRTEAFPAGPTERAVSQVDRFFALLSDEAEPKPEVTFTAELGVEARDQQVAIVRNMLDHPFAAYEDFTNRRETEGPEASFPEIGWTIKALASDMAIKPEVQQACEKSLIVRNLRNQMLHSLGETIEQGTFGYTSSLHTVEDVMSFFDLVVRVNAPDSPPPYHTARFEYNWHAVSEDPEHTVIPTMTSLSLTDLVRLRGVPVGLLGVSTDTLTVDGFPQTPYEFFHHDVDHTRRMHQETVAAIKREGITPRKYAEDASKLIAELLPLIDTSDFAGKQPQTAEEQEQLDYQTARLLIMFEVLHEDGYDATRDSIADAILRAPMEHTPFEREAADNVIEYHTGPRATLLAHVYRKLAHTFYDLPERRSSSLGSDFARTRLMIAQAASDLYRVVSDDPIDDQNLLATCKQLVSTDEGFTDAFIGNFAHDIRRRAVGRDALRLMVSKPLNVNAAVRKIQRLRPDDHIHTLFGYSALEYEDPDALEHTVLQDLANFDPTNTTIAIGATPYGIGRLYPVIKGLGFYTLGIVASTALGQNEECADGVDEIVVVRDNNWGGYRYSEETQGLLSPTTRVFLGASDSIAAYGGGGITAVTLAEAVRRSKDVSYTPFEMNHRIATMLSAQRGDNAPINYDGPAKQAWQQITNAL